MNRLFKNVLPYLVVVVSTVVIVRSLFLAFQYPGDVPEFYCSSWLLLSGDRAGMYVVERLAALEKTTFPLLNGRSVGFFLPPPALIFIAPLALLPPHLVQPIWFGACLAALPVCVLQLRRLFSLTRMQLLYSWSVIIVFGATYECLRLGQLGVFMLLALTSAMCFLKEKREWLAALCFSVLIVKPQLFVPQMVFLFALGRRTLLARTAVFSLMWIVVSGFVVGLDGWIAYYNLIKRLGQLHEFAFDNAATICGQLLRVPGLDFSVTITFSVCVWLGAMLLLYRIGQSYKHREDWLNALILAVMPVATVTSLYLMDYDLVILIPSVMLFVARRLYGKLSWVVTIPAVIMCTILLLPFHSWLRYNYLLKGAVFNPFVLSLTVLAALIISTVWRGEVGASGSAPSRT